MARRTRKTPGRVPWSAAGRPGTGHRSCPVDQGHGNGKFVRWVDYWDGRHFGVSATESLRTPPAQFPDDFGESRVGESAAPAMTRIVGELPTDFARDNSEHAAQLSDREFRLLHHLVEHAGEVMSRERLLSEVWGYHFDPGSNVVDVCVRRLRKKLGANAPIETVRNAGYRLAAA